MPLIPFTLSCNGVEKSLADWGIEDLAYEWQNLTIHTVRFTVGGRPIDAANIFPYGATVEIFQNRTTIGDGGKRWFYGRVEPWDLIGSSEAEDQIGVLAGPDWYLEHIKYKMVYVQTQNNVSTQYTTSRVVLNVLFDPVTAQPKIINTGDQIRAALQWAISQGAPIQIGNIAPWAWPATDFAKGVLCSEVIQKMWRVEPDFVAVWDHSTMPYPTVHYLKCSTVNLDPALTAPQKALLVLTPLNIDLNAGNWLDKVHIKPRPDWQKSYFNIDYDQINTVGGDSRLALGNDHWPLVLPTDTDSKFRGVDLYFDLAGSRVAVTSEETVITSEYLNIATVGQWLSWKPELNAANVASVVFAPVDAKHPAPSIVTQNGESAFNTYNNYELLDGNYCDWLNADLFNYTTAQKVRATAWLTITYKSAPGKPGHTITKQITKEFTAISWNTGSQSTTFTHTTQTTQAYAEPQPIGLAKAMYLAWQSLAAEGSITSVEQDLGNLIGFGNCLNFITPERPEWASLNALVQSISGSALRGITNVRFGAPLHLTAAQLSDLFKVERFRVPSLDLNFLFGGPLASGGGTVRHPRKTHAHSAEHGADQLRVLAVHGSQNPDTETDPAKLGGAILDPADVLTNYARNAFT